MRTRRTVALFLSALVACPHAASGQEPTIRPPENLVVEGIPAIPASLAAEVRRYTDSRSAAFVDWHPVRRELLIRTRFANTAQLHHVKMPGGDRRQLTFFDEPVGESTFEPTTGKYIVFARDAGGNEFRQLYRFDLADGRVTLLSDGGRSQNGNMEWSTAGDRMVYSSTRRNGADRDLWIMNPADPSTSRLLLELPGGGWGPLDWSPDDRRILLSEFLSVNQGRLWILDVATGRKELLTNDGADSVAYDDAEFSADGRGVYLITDKGSELLRLAYMDIATRAITSLSTGIRWDVESMALSRDGARLAFSVNEAGQSRLYLMDTRTRRFRPVTAAPAGVIGAVEWHRNSRDLAFSVASARTSGDVYSVDAVSGAVTRWTESELGGLGASTLVEPRVIRWRSFDDREITGLYYQPPATFQGKRPVIIDIHGGPEGQSRPTFLGRRNYFLNEQGVAIIFPNVRGSTGYGKTFLKLDNGMKREDSVRDIGALLDWIGRQPELDASRVMITGGSYGGFMTLAVAAMYGDRICCSLDVVGMSHLGTFLKNTESYRRDLRRAEYGDERIPEMAAFFDRTAALNNADRIRKPLFVVQGANDPRVPRTESEQMVAKVRQNGGAVWYLMAKDEGHGFAKRVNQDFQFYSTVLFVQSNLLARPTP